MQTNNSHICYIRLFRNLFLIDFLISASRLPSDKGYFEYADYIDYLPQSPTGPPQCIEYRNAAAELFLPYSGFIANRVMIAAWENDLEGGEEHIVEVLVHASQVSRLDI